MIRASEETTATRRAAHELVVDDAQSAAVDTDMIRRTCEAVLWAPRLSGHERDVAALLVGHVQLLLPEVRSLVYRARGEWWRTGLHVLTHARRTLSAVRTGAPHPADTSGLLDLATHCRALLAMYQQLSAGDDRPADCADGDQW
ncbi:DUF6415 family natural product biosynthesis protein [Streptomyces sp. NPDC001093]|uniref:DUF6415 family natural product biosynthesis protein n=1 Tax=Streptomyces sp. NPDC001093 TaxID=3154376 RepID=UPI00332DBD0A